MTKDMVSGGKIFQSRDRFNVDSIFALYEHISLEEVQQWVLVNDVQLQKESE